MTAAIDPEAVDSYRRERLAQLVARIWRRHLLEVQARESSTSRATGADLGRQHSQDKGIPSR